jgi:hypothetical protein
MRLVTKLTMRSRACGVPRAGLATEEAWRDGGGHLSPPLASLISFTQSQEISIEDCSSLHTWTINIFKPWLAPGTYLLQVHLYLTFLP